MLPSLLLLIFLTLSASSQHILTETQHSKSFLRIPKNELVHSLTSQQNLEISSKVLEEPIQFTAEDKEFPFLTQRMLQSEPVLISVETTTIPPPQGPPPGSPPEGLPPGAPPGGPPPGAPPGGMPGSPPPGGPPPGGPPPGGPPPGSPPGGPPPGNPPEAIVVTTKTYALNLENEEEIIIVVEDNQDPLEIIEAIENGQPQITNGDDIFITSWWTFEDEETVFDDWEQLEAFLETQYGSEPAIGIDVDAEDVPVEIEIIVPEVPESPPISQGTQDINEDLSEGVVNLTEILQNTSAVDWGQYEQGEIEGVDVVSEENFVVTSRPKCKQVRACQKVFVRPIGLRNVCKNQLVCPKV